VAQPRTITAYIDYKSPYAYLAKDPAYELEREFSVRVDWLPYVLDIRSFLGSARVDDSGRVVEEERNAHQWRRVRYSYMDCRRQAKKRGLVIRGPQKIWDSTLAACGMLYAKRLGDAVLRRYHDITFERFWKRARHRASRGDRRGAGGVRRRHRRLPGLFGGGGEGGARSGLPRCRGAWRFRGAELCH
jgi:2-hydroxychromene-2-carboxylate isomerase